LNQRLNWFEAEQYCNRLGGNLASFSSRRSLARVTLGQQLDERNNRFWIGLNKLNGNLCFGWSDAQPYIFASWDQGQPDNWGNFEECVEIMPNSNFNDISCYVDRGWMCRIPRGVDPTVNPIVISETFPGMYKI
jgi:hypothetical protein